MTPSAALVIPGPPEDPPCTGEPAVPSVATVMGMTPGQRDVFEAGGLSTAFVHRQQIEAVDFYYATPPRDSGGK